MVSAREAWDLLSAPEPTEAAMTLPRIIAESLNLGEENVPERLVRASMNVDMFSRCACDVGVSWSW
jgi:hypothetical protein